mgnify:FL=1
MLSSLLLNSLKFIEFVIIFLERGTNMSKETSPIPFTEFSNNVSRFFEQVISESKPVIVENEKGERAVLKPVISRKLQGRKKTQADREAFLSSLGGWKGVDVDQFLKDNEESRQLNTRPPVEL